MVGFEVWGITQLHYICEYKTHSLYSKHILEVNADSNAFDLSHIFAYTFLKTRFLTRLILQSISLNTPSHHSTTRVQFLLDGGCYGVNELEDNLLR